MTTKNPLITPPSPPLAEKPQVSLSDIQLGATEKQEEDIQVAAPSADISTSAASLETATPASLLSKENTPDSVELKPADKVPTNWDLKADGEENISGYNPETRRSFYGTREELNALLRG